MYLCIYDCELTNADLGHLVGSSHQSTLQELNLGRNKFVYDDSSTNLFELCKNLNNILHWNLKRCGLNYQPCSEHQLVRRRPSKER